MVLAYSLLMRSFATVYAMISNIIGMPVFVHKKLCSTSSFAELCLGQGFVKIVQSQACLYLKFKHPNITFLICKFYWNGCLIF